MNKPQLYLTFLFGLTVLLWTAVTPPAYATSPEESKEENEDTEAEPSVNFAKIESLGIYQKGDKNWLGKNIWEGSKRSELVQLLQDLPVEPKEPFVSKLILRALLTASDAKLVENDIAPENGKDLLTLKLGKLLEAGAYNQAYGMYELVEAEPYHEKLARAGILSMLYSGEKSLACLETNIVLERFKEQDFWRDFSIYCESSLSDQPTEETYGALKESRHSVLFNVLQDETYSYPYQPESYERLSYLEQAVLAADNKLDVSKLAEMDINKIPQRHLQILLAHDGLNNEQSFLLTLEAVARGLKPSGHMEEFYAALSSPAAGKDNADELGTPEADWEKIPYYLNNARNTKKSEDQWALIKNIFPLVKKYETEAFSGYVEIIARNKPADPEINEAKAAYEIMSASDIKIPNYWIDIINKIEPGTLEEDTDKASYATLNTTINLLRPGKDISDEEAEKLLSSYKPLEPHTQELLILIMKSLDNFVRYSNNQPKAYEKDFFLTLSVDYVMPSTVVWDRLIKVSQKKAVGETILLSTALLQDQDLQKLHPGLFRDILQSLENVGLTALSKKLAIKASLESVN